MNDLKFCIKISGLNLNEMVHLAGKNIFSPLMSKNLSGVPLTWNMSQVPVYVKIF
jgi:hypothetical protein